MFLWTLCVYGSQLLVFLLLFFNHLLIIYKFPQTLKYIYKYLIPDFLIIFLLIKLSRNKILLPKYGKYYVPT